MEDRGGTRDGRLLAEEFADKLQIRYAPLDKNFSMMGYSRNFALSQSRGEYLLFLDDDTVILQRDFLQLLEFTFFDNPEFDAVVPHGFASFAVIKGRYDYHDPYFMTSRCTAYRRSVLIELSGFIDDFIGQEDVEFVVRFLMAGKKALKLQKLEYYHPPLFSGSFSKSMAVGQSFYRARNRYPLIIWVLLIVNCVRHAPLYMVPLKRFREMGRFGIGFILGVISGMFGKKGLRYG